MSSVTGPQTFTVTNNGNQTITQIGFAFSTPTGVSHTADLSNFGGSSAYTDTNFSAVNVNLAAGAEKTFTVDYTWVSANQGTLNGNYITLTPISSAGTGTAVSVDSTIIINAPVTNEWTLSGTGGTLPYGSEITLTVGAPSGVSNTGYNIQYDDNVLQLSKTSGTVINDDGQFTDTFTITNVNPSLNSVTTNITILNAGSPVASENQTLGAFEYLGPLDWTMDGFGGTLPYGSTITITVGAPSGTPGTLNYAISADSSVQLSKTSGQLINDDGQLSDTFTITNISESSSNTDATVTISYLGATKSETQTLGPYVNVGPLDWTISGDGGVLPYGSSLTYTVSAGLGTAGDLIYAISTSDPEILLTKTTGQLINDDGQLSDTFGLTNNSTSNTQFDVTITVSYAGASTSVTQTVNGLYYTAPSPPSPSLPSPDFTEEP